MHFDTEKTQGVEPADLKRRFERERNLHCDEIGGADVATNAVPYSEEHILGELFKYHPPTHETLPKFSAINQAAKNFAEVVLANCPSGSGRAAAINAIRGARMLANAAIALKGLSLY